MYHILLFSTIHPRLCEHLISKTVFKRIMQHLVHRSMPEYECMYYQQCYIHSNLLRNHPYAYIFNGILKFPDILDRMESFERSDAESADSLDALDTYTLTSFLGQNIVSKPQGRQRKRRLRHSTAGTGNNEPRTTNRGNIITARCRPQSTSALPPSSLAAGSKADTYPRSHNESDVWQRADIPPIEENTVSNHHTYSTPPPPPPPVVQMPASVSGSLPSVTNSPARMEGTNTMNGNHNGIHRPVIQQQHSLTHSSPSRSPYHQQTVLPPQQRNGGGHHASPAGSNHHGNFQQHPVSPVHVTETYSDHLPQYLPPGHQKVAPQTVPQKAPPPSQQRAPLYRKKSQTSPVHQTSPDHSNSFQYHRNEISSFQPKKPPRTFEATEGKTLRMGIVITLVNRLKNNNF